MVNLNEESHLNVTSNKKIGMTHKNIIVVESCKLSDQVRANKYFMLET